MKTPIIALVLSLIFLFSCEKNQDEVEIYRKSNIRLEKFTIIPNLSNAKAIIFIDTIRVNIHKYNEKYEKGFVLASLNLKSDIKSSGWTSSRAISEWKDVNEDVGIVNCQIYLDSISPYIICRGEVAGANGQNLSRDYILVENQRALLDYFSIDVKIGFIGNQSYQL